MARASKRKSLAKPDRHHETVLLRIPTSKDDSSAIVARLIEFRGRERVDIRTFWCPDGQSELLPTKRGCSIPIDAAKQLIDAINRALITRGLQMAGNAAANDGSE